MNNILKRYRKLENSNNHNEAALLLVKNFGTKDEVEKLEKIKKDHEARGHILYEEQKLRYEIAQKYYTYLFI